MSRTSRSIDRLSLLVALSALPALAHGQGGAPSMNWPDLPSDEPPSTGSDAAGVDVPLGGTREPAIAVNPLDSRNVAAASLFQYRVSGDGGVSWTGPASNIVPAGYSQDGDPSLAYDHLGRLFHCYQGRHIASGGADEFVARLNPYTGAYLSGPFKASVSGSTGNYNDKCWIAADPSAASPFAGRLYTVWSEFPLAGSTRVLFSRSLDMGATWSAPLQLSVAGEGFPWPAHLAVAPNGDVYVSYHSQTGFNGIGEAGGNPDGTSGKVYVVRSTDGGVTFPQKTLAFAAGAADVTYNVQSSPGTIPGTRFWLQGSGQAWVLPDPHIAGTVYVVANDDPDNVHGAGDDANIYLAKSTNSGVSWSLPTRVDHGPGTTFQVMPTASIDAQTGCILVSWYDNRDGGTNGAGNWLLQVYSTVSCDEGATFQPDVKINNASFDPDLGAPSRFPGPPATLRIGEYIGVAAGGGDLYAIWCGNNGGAHQSITDSILSAGNLNPYCYGDESLTTACPCLNFGEHGRGCMNSATPGGAKLVTTGAPSLDNVVLTASGERPTSLSIFIQGDVDIPAGIVFGDGVRCAGGHLRRLYAKSATGGVVSAPGLGDPSIKTRSATLGDVIPPGGVRFYQIYYRDNVAAFCPGPAGNVFNITNAFRIQW